MPRRNRSNKRGKHNGDNVSSTWVASNSNESDCESTTATIGSSDNSISPSCTKFDLEKHSNSEENVEKETCEKENSKEHIESQNKKYAHNMCTRQSKIKKTLSASSTKLNNLIDSILVAALLLTLGLSVGHFVGASKCPKYVKVNGISPTLVSKCMKHAMTVYRNLINENKILKQRIHSLEKKLSDKTTSLQKSKFENSTNSTQGTDEYDQMNENSFNEIIGKDFFDIDQNKEEGVEIVDKNSVKYYKYDLNKKTNETSSTEKIAGPKKCKRTILTDQKSQTKLGVQAKPVENKTEDNGFILVEPKLQTLPNAQDNKKLNRTNVSDLIKMFEEKDEVKVNSKRENKKSEILTEENTNEQNMSFDTVINGKTYATDKYYDSNKKDKQTKREKHRSSEKKSKSKKNNKHHVDNEHKVYT